MYISLYINFIKSQWVDSPQKKKHNVTAGTPAKKMRVLVSVGYFFGFQPLVWCEVPLVSKEHLEVRFASWESKKSCKIRLVYIYIYIHVIHFLCHFLYIYWIIFKYIWNNQRAGFEVLRTTRGNDVFIEVQVLRRAAREGVNVDATGNSEVCWWFLRGNIGVSKNSGTPKWMVKIMENPSKMDDLGGKPTIFGNIHMGINMGETWG